MAHFRDVLPSQSLGMVLKKLNQTHPKQTTQEQSRARDVLPNIHHTQAAKSSCHCAALPSPRAATEWCHLLLHIIYSVRRMSHNALSVGMMQQFVRFVPGELDL